MIGCREDVDEDGDGSSSVLDGWLVANYLMMSIANGGAGQKKIGKIRQQRSFTLGGDFFSCCSLKQKQRKPAASVCPEGTRGHFPEPLRFWPFERIDDKDFFFFSKQFHDTLGCNFRWLEYYSAAAGAGAGGGHNTQSNHWLTAAAFLLVVTNLPQSVVDLDHALRAARGWTTQSAQQSRTVITRNTQSVLLGERFLQFLAAANSVRT